MTDTASPLHTTAAWLRTDQAAMMTQLDEQVRGADSGLTPGTDNAAQFASWITGHYGPLPPIGPTPHLNATAHIAAKLCHWRAHRLEHSASIVVDNDAAHAANTLATKQTWHIPPLPQLTDATIFWPTQHAANSRFHSTDPTGAVTNSCTAVTISTAIHRLMEWSPAPDADTLDPSLRRLLAEGQGALPPLLLEGDSFYPRTPLDEQAARISIIRAMSLPPGDEPATTVNATAALLVGVTAGLFALRQDAAHSDRWRISAPD